MKRLLPAFLVVLATCLGCGDSGPTTYEVQGTVSYQGKPLPLGTVMFVPANGPPSQPAAIGADGHYELRAVEGQHSVQVIAMPPREGGRPDPNVEGGIDYTGVPPVKSLIPKKYNRFDTSGVTVTVKPTGENKLDITLP